MPLRGSILFWLIALPCVFAANYLLALAGEPRAYWLMHTVLGIL